MSLCLRRHGVEPVASENFEGRLLDGLDLLSHLVAVDNGCCVTRSISTSACAWHERPILQHTHSTQPYPPLGQYLCTDTPKIQLTVSIPLHFS